ncbi:MAG: acetyltransferase [Desulfobulbaceae bacterium]|nr:acetyltransferase [Desulfobulbaceae bacterium]
MTSFDIFNGDADGICALHQLRLHTPKPEARLITGVKRDIRLLDRIAQVADSDITVLDISMDRNRDALLALLKQGNTVFYVDHHFSGDIPNSPLLDAHIDPAPQTCTSLIVDRLLKGKYRGWAVVGAFGDNLDEAAQKAAQPLHLNNDELSRLQETGILLNYNGYGANQDDLFIPPDQLFSQIRQFDDPLLFHAQSPILQTLRQGYQDDMDRAGTYSPIQENSSGRVFELPGASWSRRVAGVFANTLAREQPKLAHALLMPNDDDSLRISVRAPLNRRHGADELCRRFPTGGGRAAAAGINQLPPEQKDAFLAAFSDQFSA